MANVRKVFYYFWLFLSFSMAAQKKEVSSSEFFGFTNDVFVRNGVEYMCSISPLSFFDNYKDVFGNQSSDASDPASPIVMDKNYIAKWRIWKKTLYLYEIELLEGSDHYPNKYQMIEELTSTPFSLDMSLYPNILEDFPMDGLRASWFSGFIYIKRQPTFDESYCDCMYRSESFNVLGFLNGNLVYEKEVNGMEFYIDSKEIMSNPKKYEIQYNTYEKISPCVILLKESLSLDTDERFYDRFFGHTNDNIRLKETLHMLSVSPLSFYKNYKDIYASTVYIDDFSFLPIVSDKNYSAKWVVLDDKLYLYDITFAAKEVKDGIIGDSSLKVVEKLTGQKFRKIPSFDKKVLFAAWYSGTLYLKRYWDQNERIELGCKFNCEPMTKISFKNGKITSIEPTTYMIYKF